MKRLQKTTAEAPLREVVCGTVYLIYDTFTAEIVWASLSLDDAKQWEADKPYGRYNIESEKLMGYGK